MQFRKTESLKIHALIIVIIFSFSFLLAACLENMIAKNSISFFNKNAAAFGIQELAQQVSRFYCDEGSRHSSCEILVTTSDGKLLATAPGFIKNNSAFTFRNNFVFKLYDPNIVIKIHSNPGVFYIFFLGSFSILFYFIVIGLLTISRARAEHANMQLKLQHGSELQKNTEKLNELSVRIAHDIRAPVGVLKNALTLQSQDSKKLVLEATQRIEQIANELLGEFRQQQASSSQKNDLIAAKRSSYPFIEKSLRSIVAITQSVDQKIIIWNSNPLADVSFVDISPLDLERIFQNLLNNAIEASPNTPVIIEIKIESQKLIISIKDNGRGINDETLKMLGTKGFTQKENGTGFGLYSSKQIIESIGGSLFIDSKVGLGTLVQISIPIQEKPKWFFDNFKAYSSRNIILLDDDSSIVQKLCTHAKKEILYFQKISEFKNHYQEHFDEDPFYFIDYQIGKEATNGLEIISLFGIAENSCLITNQWDDPKIQESAQNVGVKILPKVMIE